MLGILVFEAEYIEHIYSAIAKQKLRYRRPLELLEEADGKKLVRHLSNVNVGRCVDLRLELLRWHTTN